MKTVLKSLLLPAFIIAGISFAKAVSMGEVTGQVLEHETNKPVAFAEVIFENGMDRMVVTANEYGVYYSPHMPTGRYQMRVVFNNRTFVMNKIKVYDSYASEVNFVVSNNEQLPLTVEVIKKEQLIDPLEPNDIRLTANLDNSKGTRTLAEVLNQQPGVDVRDGKIYVKGSDQVRFFIDGTPVLASPTLNR